MKHKVYEAIAIRKNLGDVAENRDFISLSHEMEIPMAEIARHVGYVDQLSLRQFKRWNQRIRFIDFINVPIFGFKEGSQTRCAHFGGRRFCPGYFEGHG